jgi:hypothetical protein
MLPQERGASLAEANAGLDASLHEARAAQSRAQVAQARLQQEKDILAQSGDALREELDRSTQAYHTGAHGQAVWAAVEVEATGWWGRLARSVGLCTRRTPGSHGRRASLPGRPAAGPLMPAGRCARAPGVCRAPQGYRLNPRPAAPAE